MCTQTLAEAVCRTLIEDVIGTLCLGGAVLSGLHTARGLQAKLAALAAGVRYQELSDPAVWDRCGALDDAVALLQVCA